MIATVLIIALWLSFTIWIGGNLIGQIWLLAARLNNDSLARVIITRQIYWSISRVYLPLQLIGVGTGLAQASRVGIPLTKPFIILPIAIIALNFVFTCTFVLRQYASTVELSYERDPSDPQLQKKIDFLSTLNRVELLFLVVGIGVGIVR